MNSKGGSARFWCGFLLLFPLILCSLGCGGGGSGNGGGITSGALVAVLVPIKISTAGSTDQDGIFASIKGAGTSGGWIEDTKATRIPNSDLVMEPVANAYQMVLKGDPGIFLTGAYTLKYTLNGTVQEYKPGNLEWTTPPRFTSGVSYTWDPNSRYLTITAPNLPGSVKYQIELYSYETGNLRRQSNEFISGGSITEYVSESGSFQVVLVANVYEAENLKSKAVYNFKDLLVTN